MNIQEAVAAAYEKVYDELLVPDRYGFCQICGWNVRLCHCRARIERGHVPEPDSPAQALTRGMLK